MKSDYPTNEEISEVLEQVTELLVAQDANPYRVRAYRRTSQVVGRFDKSIAEIAHLQDAGKLEELPNIGRSIAGVICEFVHTRRRGLLDRLEGQISSEELFSTVQGIGEVLAKRIHLNLHIDTLEDLELAGYDGRLEQVPGIAHVKCEVLGILWELY